MQENFLDTLPTWGVWATYLVAFGLAAGFGFRAGDLVKRRKPDAKLGASSLGGILGLIGFLVAFTFGMAQSQFENRRQLVIDDANAIGTTYLRAALIPEPHASTSRRLLGAYIDNRHQLEDTAEKKEAKLREEISIHGALWAEATAASAADPSPIVGTYLLSLNEMIDLHATRVETLRWLRIPDLIFTILGILSILAIFLIGYHLALDKVRLLLPMVLFVVVYSVVFTLVVDLDRPGSGFFQVSQQPMIGAANVIAEDLKAHPPNP